MILHSKTVFFEGDKDGPQGFFVRPDDDKTYPGLVLIQEWWGIEPHVLDMANQLATEGFAVMVPDLYHGQIATEPDDAGKLILLVVQNVQRALGEVKLATDQLLAMPNVGPKVGIMGFCMGGFVTALAAQNDARYAAFSPWYPGGYDPSPEDVARITAPVLAIFGENDGSIPVARIKKIERLYADAGKKGDFRIYPNAGHAFNNPDHGMYVEDAAKDAWSRAVAFFKRELLAVSH